MFYAVSGQLDQGACAALLSDGLQAHAGALPQALALDGKMIRHHLGLLTLAQHEDGAPQAVAASAVEFPFARGIVVVRSATTEKKKPDRHRDAPRRVEREGADHTPSPWRSLVRGHWGGVEIRNHGRRDAVRGEDRSRTRHPGQLASLALPGTARFALVPEHFPVVPTRRSTNNSTPVPPPA